jgi:hypothetical protein
MHEDLLCLSILNVEYLKLLHEFLKKLSGAYRRENSGDKNIGNWFFGFDWI